MADARTALRKLQSGQSLTGQEKKILGISTPETPVNNAATDEADLQEALAAAEAAKIDESRKAAEEAEAAADARVAAAAKGGEGATFTATDGTVFNDEATYNRYQELLDDKTSIADTRKRDGESAYNILYKKFSELGLGSLVQEVERYIKDGLSEEEFTLRLRETDTYKKRFGANRLRLDKGLSALSEAEYIGMEDQYQEVMRQYGLPASYYEKDDIGTQKGFIELLAGDVSNTELEDRLIMAQERVIRGAPQIAQALKEFYPEITNGDILAYALDPKNAIKNIQRKVTAAEIGGAQLGAGLQATKTGAEDLAKAGVTGAKYQASASDISEASIRGGQLASMYKEDPYTQQTAEQAVLNTPGSAAAIRQTKKLTELERAAFSGQSGLGVLAREKAGAI